jgi:hypothetical protein
MKKEKTKRKDPTKDLERTKTVGELSNTLILQDPGDITANEQMQEQLNDYESNLFQCVDEAKKTIINQDFFVVVLTKKEPLMQNVIRNYFFARVTCPTPEWDQAIFKYHHKDDYLQFLWVLPSKDTCEYLKINALILPDEEKALLNFVLLLEDGSLLRYAKKENKEQKDSIILEK